MKGDDSWKCVTTLNHADLKHEGVEKKENGNDITDNQHDDTNVKKEDGNDVKDNRNEGTNDEKGKKEDGAGVKKNQNDKTESNDNEEKETEKDETTGK
jgi:hypothetical protein